MKGRTAPGWQSGGDGKNGGDKGESGITRPLGRQICSPPGGADSPRYATVSVITKY